MSVLASRLDLYDSGATNDQQQHSSHTHLHPPCPPIAPFSHQPPTAASSTGSIAVCRVPHQRAASLLHQNDQNADDDAPQWMELAVVDNSTPCPYEDSSITKYWRQRRRLFSKFDQGIQLDEEGWFSVTPEQIARHVARQLRHLLSSPLSSTNNNESSHHPDVIVLDAFCGCGGNAIAFGQQPNMTVVGVDLDRGKLRRAAHNAAIYGIPPDRLILIECNVLFVLEYCYRSGQFVLDQPLPTPEAATKLMNAMPAAVMTETTKDGYQIGGIDCLPRRIDAIFMDPPWGGVDYEVFGKHGYDLATNMKIARPAQATTATAVGDDFFDTFCASSSPQQQQQQQRRNKKERRAQFNCHVDDTNCVNGAELLGLAAAATKSAVLYDVPRNTNRQSLGLAALAAGYRGNCRWDEHYLNGRLKTVTAYFGRDWSGLMQLDDDDDVSGDYKKGAMMSSS